MVTGGIEVMISMLQEEVIGPLVLFGVGGAAAQMLADRAARRGSPRSPTLTPTR